MKTKILIILLFCYAPSIQGCKKENENRHVTINIYNVSSDDIYVRAALYKEPYKTDIKDSYHSEIVSTNNANLVKAGTRNRSACRFYRGMTYESRMRDEPYLTIWFINKTIYDSSFKNGEFDFDIVRESVLEVRVYTLEDLRENSFSIYYPELPDGYLP